MGLFLPQPVIQHFLPSAEAGTDPGRHTKLTNLLLNYMKSKYASLSFIIKPILTLLRFFKCHWRLFRGEK